MLKTIGLNTCITDVRFYGLSVADGESMIQESLPANFPPFLRHFVLEQEVEQTGVARFVPLLCFVKEVSAENYEVSMLVANVVKMTFSKA